jgi:hypothetical protein
MTTITEQTRATIIKANEIALGDRMKEIIEKYKTDTHYPKTQHVHNIVTGSALKLVNDVRDNGGTEKEMDQVIEYLAVCIQAHKYKINIKKYGKENGIWDLRKKYQPWRTQMLEKEKRVEALEEIVDKAKAEEAENPEEPEIE